MFVCTDFGDISERGSSARSFSLKPHEKIVLLVPVTASKEMTVTLGHPLYPMFRIHQEYIETSHQDYIETSHQEYIETSHQDYIETSHQDYIETSHQEYT